MVTVILIISSISCTKEAKKAPQSISHITEENATKKAATHYIGERFGGGVIFLMDKTKLQGLIADTVDLPSATWYLGAPVKTGARGISIGSGPSNTLKIITTLGRVGSYAALECAKSKRSGYTDWFLPSKNELNELFKQKNLVGVFASDFYWSSSEANDILAAWGQFFNSGSQNPSGENAKYYVRAVRAF